MDSLGHAKSELASVVLKLKAVKLSKGRGASSVQNALGRGQSDKQRGVGVGEEKAEGFTGEWHSSHCMGPWVWVTTAKRSLCWW